MLALLWAAYQLRVRQLAYQFNVRWKSASARVRASSATCTTVFSALLLRF
jgi:hypothetical protein